MNFHVGQSFFFQSYFAMPLWLQHPPWHKHSRVARNITHPIRVGFLRHSNWLITYWARGMAPVAQMASICAPRINDLGKGNLALTTPWKSWILLWIDYPNNINANNDLTKLLHSRYWSDWNNPSSPPCSSTFLKESTVKKLFQIKKTQTGEGKALFQINELMQCWREPSKLLNGWALHMLLYRDT
jgi:hypothetical protein